MLKRCLSGGVVWTLGLAGCFAWGQLSGRAFQQESPPVVPIRAEAGAVKYEIPLNSVVAQQMFALERHARADMILYANGSNGWQLASIAAAPTVVALGASTGR